MSGKLLLPRHALHSAVLKIDDGDTPLGMGTRLFLRVASWIPIS